MGHQTWVVLVLLLAVWVQWGSSMRNLKGTMGGTNSARARVRDASQVTPERPGLHLPISASAGARFKPPRPVAPSFAATSPPPRGPLELSTVVNEERSQIVPSSGPDAVNLIADEVDGSSRARGLVAPPTAFSLAAAGMDVDSLPVSGRRGSESYLEPDSPIDLAHMGKEDSEERQGPNIKRGRPEQEEERFSTPPLKREKTQTAPRPKSETAASHSHSSSSLAFASLLSPSPSASSSGVARTSWSSSSVKPSSSSSSASARPFVDPSERESKASHRETPPRQQATALIELEGAAASFRDSTAGRRVELGLLQLLQISGKTSGVTIRQVSQDRFVAQGDEETTGKVQQGWQAVWASHRRGVGTVKNPDQQRAIFLNWAEPVVDIVLVVVLFNPVSYDLDLRESTTVRLFWDAVQRAAAKGIGRDPKAFVRALERRTVFLDLVPLLDNPKDQYSPQGQAARNAVDAAAKDNTYGAYFAERIEAYNTMNSDLEVIFASGKSKTRNKKSVTVPALGHLTRLGIGPNRVTDVNFHPVAMQGPSDELKKKNPKEAEESEDWAMKARAEYATKLHSGVLGRLLKKMKPKEE